MVRARLVRQPVGCGRWGTAKDRQVHGEILHRGVLSRRGVRMTVDHITFYTPLQEYGGIITPAHPALAMQRQQA
jgi:hypothetical protein